MTFNASAESDATDARVVKKTQTDSLVATLATEFLGATSCEIRVAVLQAEENLWPKKDAYILLDHARELLRRGPV